MKKNVLKISLGAGALLAAVCLLASYMGDIKERKETKVIKSESVNYAEGMVTYEISEESRGEIKQLVAETVKGIGVSLTDSQLEELTAKVTEEVQLKIEAQYESDINEALKGTIGGGQVTEDDIDDLKDDIEATIKRETSKTPSVLYGELKENLRLEDTISAYLEEQGYLSTDNIATYMASKEYKDNVDARIAKAMQQNKAETSQDISKLSDQVAGDLKNSVNSLKNDISSLESKQATDKRTLEQSIRTNGDAIAALENSSLAASTFNTFYSQYQIDYNAVRSDISNLESDLDSKDAALNSRIDGVSNDVQNLDSDLSSLESRVSTNESDISSVSSQVGNINVYVSNDGKLHYVDKDGADTALNFSSNPRISSINQRSSRPNSNYDYNETWTISQDNTGVKYTVSLSNDNGCHGWSCGVYKKDGTCIASGGRSITWQGTLNKGDYVRWKQDGGHASTDYYGSAVLIEVVFEK